MQSQYWVARGHIAKVLFPPSSTMGCIASLINPLSKWFIWLSFLSKDLIPPWHYLSKGECVLLKMVHDTGDIAQVSPVVPNTSIVTTSYHTLFLHLVSNGGKDARHHFGTITSCPLLKSEP